MEQILSLQSGILTRSPLGRVFKPFDPPQLLTKAPALKRGENSLKVLLKKGDLGGSKFLYKQTLNP
jgi:hypothetical protein